MSEFEAQQATPLAPQLPSGWTALDIALLAGVLVFACVLRIWNIDHDLSFDELWHLATTPGLGSPLGKFPNDVLLSGLPSQTGLDHAAPFWMVWTHMDGVLHPPLFCLSLRLWRDTFGQSDLAAHLYSTFWSMIAIGFLFATTRLALDRWAALIVGVGTAISQVQIYYAQEVRSYQLLIAIASYALWVMMRIEKLGPTRQRAVVLAALTFPLLLTHYFAAGAAIAIGVYGLLRLRGQRIAFIATGALSGLIYLFAWVPFALRQVHDLDTGDSFLRVAKVDYVRELLLVMCAPWRTIVDKDYQAEHATVAAGLLLIVPWLLVRRNRALLPWAIWLLLSVLAIAALDVVRMTAHLTFPRYYSVASPAVLPLAVGIVWSLDRRTGYVLGVALLTLIALGRRVDAAISVDSPFHADARNYVRPRIGPGEALLIYNGTAQPDYNEMLALTFSHVPEFKARPTIKMTRPLSPELVAQLPRSAWLVTYLSDIPLSVLVPGARVIEVHEVKDQALLLHLQIRDEMPDTQPSATTRP